MGSKDTRVVFSLRGRQFGVSAENVLEMTILNECTRIPNKPESVRGVINLRGRVMPVFDTRLLMGITSAQKETEELIAMLKQREEDHRRWVKELEDAIREEREFKLTTDPTKCAFGKWYYSFKTDNSALKFLLEKFDRPHRDIHAQCVEVLGLAAKGLRNEARERIRIVRETTLSSLFLLFEELYQAVREHSREIGIVMTAGGEKAIFAVDSVEAVETLQESSAEAFAETMAGLKTDPSVCGIGKRKGNESLVFLLDVATLLGGLKGTC